MRAKTFAFLARPNIPVRLHPIGPPPAPFSSRVSPARQLFSPARLPPRTRLSPARRQVQLLCSIPLYLCALQLLSPARQLLSAARSPSSSCTTEPRSLLPRPTDSTPPLDPALPLRSTAPLSCSKAPLSRSPSSCTTKPRSLLPRPTYSTPPLDHALTLRSALLSPARQLLSRSCLRSLSTETTRLPFHKSSLDSLPRLKLLLTSLGFPFSTEAPSHSPPHTEAFPASSTAVPDLCLLYKSYPESNNQLAV
ncbi:proline-rich receptor-like protein kinase PERK2 [Phalaenopsis equestris]|uniref:proline-rich receptor-like protein kinase PERK2 n=1 Tax=Phalaenopsis equestris TaxID=78828 RepID=UPI0009E20724|nr:proline-rich receptor-like protein kinase PERK2 [Phalaenopsis equestris]